jgi:hypothetical protein
MEKYGSGLVKHALSALGKTFNILFFCIETRLCRVDELGYEQDLCMLFSNHPYFLLIGIVLLDKAYCSSSYHIGNYPD